MLDQNCLRNTVECWLVPRRKPYELSADSVRLILILSLQCSSHTVNCYIGGGDNATEGILEGGARKVSEHGDGGEVPGEYQRRFGEGEAGSHTKQVQ